MIQDLDKFTLNCLESLFFFFFCWGPRRGLA